MEIKSEPAGKPVRGGGGEVAGRSWVSSRCVARGCSGSAAVVPRQLRVGGRAHSSAAAAASRRPRRVFKCQSCRKSPRTGKAQPAPRSGRREAEQGAAMSVGRRALRPRGLYLQTDASRVLWESTGISFPALGICLRSSALSGTGMAPKTALTYSPCFETQFLWLLRSVP